MAKKNAAKDVGPDPGWGVGLFVVGLLVMSVAGAATWHWVFNVGEALLLIGAMVFLAFVAMTSQKQDPVNWREAFTGLFRRGDD